MTARLAAPLAALLAALVLAPALGAAGEPKEEPEGQEPPAAPRVPVHLWADGELRYIRDENRARASGNVTVIKKTLRIDADQVDAVIDPETNQFQRIVARGDVHIYSVQPIEEHTSERPELDLQKELRKAIGEQADYDPVNEVVVLLGTAKKQPRVWINTDEVQADHITYDHKNDVAVFEGKVRLAALTPVSKTGEEEGERPAATPE
ncbi:MAG: LptA/OstA family protein [Candidatus Brocadiia bacterium]